MKVITCYPAKAKKIYHAVPGDVVSFVHNDGTAPDGQYYLVLDDRAMTRRPESARPVAISVVNLHTGRVDRKSVSCRVIVHDNAGLCFDVEEEC